MGISFSHGSRRWRRPNSSASVDHDLPAVLQGLLQEADDFFFYFDRTLPSETVDQNSDFRMRLAQDSEGVGFVQVGELIHEGKHCVLVTFAMG